MAFNKRHLSLHKSLPASATAAYLRHKAIASNGSQAAQGTKELECVHHSLNGSSQPRPARGGAPAVQLALDALTAPAAQR